MNPSDTTLIEKAKGGDHSAFEELYVRHNRRAYAIGLRMTGNHADAEDLVQEAFLKLHRKLGTFRGESAFTTWFHRLVVTTALMRLRGKNHHSETSLDELVETGDGEFQQEIAITDSHLALSVERLAFHEALEKLPPRCRTVFWLHDVEGYEHHEIAARMGTTVGGSKSQLHRARMRLLSILNPLAILSNFEKFLEEPKGEQDEP